MIKRHSPVQLESSPARTEIRNGWEIVLSYEEEGQGPWLIDLSHVSKWDIQAADLSKIQPDEVMIPETPGSCVLEKGRLISRMRYTQAAIWHLSGKNTHIPDQSVYTDITEAYALLGVLGKGVFLIMEKITALDLQSPRKRWPFLLQGPVAQVNGQVVVLNRDAVVFAFARGYAQTMVEAILDAGMQGGIRPAGELAFNEYMERSI
ncbi:MAG: sarcosine oxidase subunit gamma SoxG [Desulfobacterales bacterium]|jgi:hypothetical protein